jgi:hypothetical protein
MLSVQRGPAANQKNAISQSLKTPILGTNRKSFDGKQFTSISYTDSAILNENPIVIVSKPVTRRYPGQIMTDQASVFKNSQNLAPVRHTVR